MDAAAVGASALKFRCELEPAVPVTLRSIEAGEASAAGELLVAAATVGLAASDT